MATQGCPCGYFNSNLKDCACTPAQIHRYLSKISGPLLDRIDLHVDVPEVKLRELTRDRDGEPSEVIAARVARARRVQLERLARTKILNNAQMEPAQIRQFCPLTPPAKAQLELAISRLGFSARAYDRILKVSRTIADLEGSPSIAEDHVAEAVHYRSLDRDFWQSL